MGRLPNELEIAKRSGGSHLVSCQSPRSAALSPFVGPFPFFFFTKTARRDFIVASRPRSTQKSWAKTLLTLYTCLKPKAIPATEATGTERALRASTCP